MTLAVSPTGSHGSPRFPGTHDDPYLQQWLSVLPGADRTPEQFGAAELATGPAGTALLMNSRLLHCGGENQSGRRRRLFYMCHGHPWPWSKVGSTFEIITSVTSYITYMYHFDWCHPLSSYHPVMISMKKTLMSWEIHGDWIGYTAQKLDSIRTCRQYWRPWVDCLRCMDHHLDSQHSLLLLCYVVFDCIRIYVAYYCICSVEYPFSFAAEWSTTFHFLSQKSRTLPI